MLSEDWKAETHSFIGGGGANTFLLQGAKWQHWMGEKDRVFPDYKHKGGKQKENDTVFNDMIYDHEIMAKIMGVLDCLTEYGSGQPMS